jgi:uncharacterized protein
MIIDFHSHYGEGDGKDITFEKIELHLRKNKISTVVLFAITSNHMIEDSLEILKLSKKDTRVIPFFRFNPNITTRKQLESLLKKGFKGVKLHPRSQNFNPLDKKFTWIWQTVQKFDIPIIFHCKSYHFDPNSHPEVLLKLAKRYPKQVFIFGHFAGVNKSLFKEYVKHPNIYVETSIDVTPNAYREVVLNYGFDRLLFGTDFPFSFGEIELLKLNMANLPKSIIEKILYKNAEQILRLK